MKRITIAVLSLLFMGLMIVFGTNTALCNSLIDMLTNSSELSDMIMKSCTWNYPGPYPIPVVNP